MLARKEYDNQHCHNKHQTENGDGMWMTSYPEQMGWGWAYFEKEQLKVDIGGRQLSSLPLGHTVEFSNVAAAVKIFGFLPTDNLNTKIYAVRWDGVSIVRIFFSLLVSKKKSQNLINSSYLNNGVRLHLYMHLCCVFEYVFVVPLLLISPNYIT